jgi:hypothetical protein
MASMAFWQNAGDEFGACRLRSMEMSTEKEQFLKSYERITNLLCEQIDELIRLSMKRLMAEMRADSIRSFAEFRALLLEYVRRGDGECLTPELPDEVLMHCIEVYTEPLEAHWPKGLGA